MATGAGIRLAVIQGETDPFGSPDEVRAALGASAEVVSARGSHSFTKTPADVFESACRFLADLLVSL
jgi:predicted alpha/beta-hydrolase family hydrolase